MKIFALTSIFLILLAGVVLAQNDPIGETDTVSISPVSVSPGQEFSVNVNLWNDEELGAITLPFVYPIDKLEFVGLDFTGGRIDYLATKPVTVDETAGTILVGAVVIMEAYVQPGSGPLCSITFKAKDNVTPGEVITIDTAFIPPINNLMLTDNSGVSNFTPAFVSGQVSISSANQKPYFTPIPDIYVAEGDSLYIDVEVTDPDGDNVVIVNPIHPYDAEFTDNGDGTGRFAWMPDYIGPLSADMSPFYFIFWTSDGEASNYIRVKVNVINVNRAPEINAPLTVEAEAGDSLSIHVSAFDPDFENTVWDISGLPSGASFDGENPGLISWNSDFADSGNYSITLIATDPYGLSDTATIDIELRPVTLFSLHIDTLTSFSGREVTIAVSMKNKFAVSGFSFLLHLDPSVLTVIDISRASTRCADFGYFDYRLNENNIPGNIRISGQAEGADPIGEGEGVLFNMTIRISPDLNFVGQQVPIRFYHLFSDDNVLTLDDGTRVYQSELNLFDGHILIAASGEILLGDINLNGIAYEISDAVYFSNFFINASQYPFNEQQIVNSDINRDGYAPSIADLVMLVGILTGEIEPPVAKPLSGSVTADVHLVRNETGLFLVFDSPVDIGGAFVRLTGTDVKQINAVNLTEMDMMNSARNNAYSCLFISYDKKSIPSGQREVIQLSDDSRLDINLESVDLADIQGQIVTTEKIENKPLPNSFELLQNYPNPFNPTTEIRFNLDTPAWVTLTVYNILGQEVIRLTDKEYPAGQHSITWNSTDSRGQQVASGIYLYRINAGEHSASRKMVLLK